MRTKICLTTLMLFSQFSFGAVRSLWSASRKAFNVITLEKNVRDGHRKILTKGLENPCPEVRKVFASAFEDEGFPMGHLRRERFYMEAVLKSVPGFNSHILFLANCYPKANVDDLRNVLHLAALSNASEVLELALTDCKGLDFDVLELGDIYLNTPMDLAVLQGNLLSVKVLAEAGAIITKQQQKVATELGHGAVAHFISQKIAEQ